ncbi:MAG TPA: SUMF1/EgtB/PvdO family nonheme iron enzyme [Bacteroidales bacterium]|nr:SUMF1/EgtB/PvdO family nonheme iron enzyme [Bacteroidales bacterium]HSA42275.1 SUMF1/EgtB/PvdO family nonheme iron enzyme [Bacteroidales bacterium]
MKKTTVLILIMLSCWPALFSNNIKVSDVSLSAGIITFSLSWDNSWNDAVNHDAAWVFVKYRYPLPEWQHVILNTAGHVLPAGCLAVVPADGMGVFLYRSAGVGGNAFQNLQLSWNLAVNGIGNTDSIQVKVFAIEMVYVPEGSFYAGDGVSTGSLRQVATNTPVLISDQPVVIKCGNTSYDDAQLEGNGILVDGDGGIDMLGTTSINNPDYPTGFKAFYCMKYEISQGQWADFLNSLTAAQCVTRYHVTTANRYTISGNWPYLMASAPDRACNFLNWPDGCAYADWAGLRPMTELEYEKACRGPQAVVAGEYTWGSTAIYNVAYTLINNGGQNELAANQGVGTGNAAYDVTNGSLDGPLRCGIFAAGALNKTRLESGATYWGIMEMSGNLWERTVSLGSTTGRYYSGLHGNGALNSAGNADVSIWPGLVTGAVTGADGSGFRGGGWDVTSAYLRLSARIYASDVYTVRSNNHGFRICRSAP